MMKYFKFRSVTTDFTTLSIVIPYDTVAYQYTETLAGVDIADSEAFLAQQHPECEVTEQTFQDVESELKECRLYRDIDEIVRTMIHNRYSLDDEIKLLKLDKLDPEFIEYQSYVASCKSFGRGMKVERGLKQND